MSRENTAGTFRPAGLQDFLVLLGLWSLTAVQMKHFADDPGVGWHLQNGAYILNNSIIPRLDPFLAGESARHWVSDQWLSDIIFYLLYTVNSWPFLYACLCSLFLFSYFIVLYRGVSLVSGTAIGASIAVLLAFKMGQMHFILRASMLGFFFFSIVYLKIYSLRKELAGEKAVSFKGRFVLLPLIFLLWANTHPSFALGLFVLALFPLSLICDRIFFPEAEAKISVSALRRSIFLFLLCLAVTFVNPYGLDLHHSIFSLGQSDFFMNFHQEWTSPDFKETAGQLFEISVFLMLFVFFLAGRKKLKWGFFELLLLLCLAHFGLQSRRVLPYFAIAATVPLAQCIALLLSPALIDNSGLMARLGRAFSVLEKRENSSFRGFSLTCLLIVLVLIGALVKERVAFYPGPFGPGAEKYPYSAMVVLDKEAEGGSELVVAAPARWGGFITWRGYPGYRAVIDDRNTLLGEDFYKKWREEMKVNGKWQEYLSSLSATHLLIPSKSSLAAFIMKCGTLRVLHKDKISVLFDLGS